MQTEQLESFPYTRGLFLTSVVVRLKTSEPLSPGMERLSVIQIVLLMTSMW